MTILPLQLLNSCYWKTCLTTLAYYHGLRTPNEAFFIEKSLSLYFDWPKSWIWWTLEKVMNIFSKWHFHNASKGVFWPQKNFNFMHRFKSAILATFSLCQNGTFDPVHEIQKNFWSKDFFWGIMKVPFTNNTHNMPQDPPNPGFMQ